MLSINNFFFLYFVDVQVKSQTNLIFEWMIKFSLFFLCNTENNLQNELKNKVLLIYFYSHLSFMYVIAKPSATQKDLLSLFATFLDSLPNIKLLVSYIKLSVCWKE